MAQDAMTWTAVLSLAAGIVGFALGYWSRSRDGVAQVEPARQPGGVGDVGPTEFSAFWDGR